MWQPPSTPSLTTSFPSPPPHSYWHFSWHVSPGRPHRHQIKAPRIERRDLSDNYDIVWRIRGLWIEFHSLWATYPCPLVTGRAPDLPTSGHYLQTNSIIARLTCYQLTATSLQQTSVFHYSRLGSSVCYLGELAVKNCKYKEGNLCVWFSKPAVNEHRLPWAILNGHKIYDAIKLNYK